jgi:hypothetical protein
MFFSKIKTRKFPQGQKKILIFVLTQNCSQADKLFDFFRDSKRMIKS